jgi:adenylylsulfate kinase-like enzyme
VSAHGTSLLIAGPSETGKSTIATAILEQLIQRRYQFCLIDPEGDYAHFEDAIVLGDSRTAPDRRRAA